MSERGRQSQMSARGSRKSSRADARSRDTGRSREGRSHEGKSSRGQPSERNDRGSLSREEARVEDIITLPSRTQRRKMSKSTDAMPAEGGSPSVLRFASKKKLSEHGRNSQGEQYDRLSVNDVSQRQGRKGDDHTDLNEQIGRKVSGHTLEPSAHFVDSNSYITGINYLYETWKEIKGSARLEELGLALMRNLIQSFPNKFCSRQKEESEFSLALSTYHSVFIDMLDQAIGCSTDLQALQICLKPFGRIFNMFGNHKQNFERIGKSIMRALDTVLGDAFTTEVQITWMRFVKRMINNMVTLNAEAEKAPPEFTLANIDTVQQTVQLLREDSKSMTLFKHLFEVDPEIIKDFGLESADDLSSSKKMRRLQQKLLKTLAHLVANLHNWEGLRQLIAKLGELHQLHGVNYEKYMHFGNAFLEMVTEATRQYFTADIHIAWERVYQGISSAMMRQLFVPEPQELVDKSKDNSSMKTTITPKSKTPHSTSTTPFPGGQASDQNKSSFSNSNLTPMDKISSKAKSALEKRQDSSTTGNITSELLVDNTKSSMDASRPHFEKSQSAELQAVQPEQTVDLLKAPKSQKRKNNSSVTLSHESSSDQGKRDSPGGMTEVQQQIYLYYKPESQAGKISEVDNEDESQFSGSRSQRRSILHKSEFSQHVDPSDIQLVECTEKDEKEESRAAKRVNSRRSSQPDSPNFPHQGQSTLMSIQSRRNSEVAVQNTLKGDNLTLGRGDALLQTEISPQTGARSPAHSNFRGGHAAVESDTSSERPQMDITPRAMSNSSHGKRGASSSSLTQSEVDEAGDEQQPLTVQSARDSGRGSPARDYDRDDSRDEIEEEAQVAVENAVSENAQRDASKSRCEIESIDSRSRQSSHRQAGASTNRSKSVEPEPESETDMSASRRLLSSARMRESSRTLKKMTMVPGHRNSVVTQSSSQAKAMMMSHIEKDVDFHHKMSYRFEKVYRLGKQLRREGKNVGFLNVDIIQCVSDYSAYIEVDRTSLFYCLFFCVYYNNFIMVEFFRSLIQKLEYVDTKTDKLLEYIDTYGCDRIRHHSDPIHSVVYHMVFYRAIDNDLRIVYSNVIRNLKFIQLRDKDALHLLVKRDFELIERAYKLHPTKINLNQFYGSQKFSVKANTYRQYNVAYFEEILISNEVDERVSFEFRKRFLKTAKDSYIVFQMYCKEDYHPQFLASKRDHLTQKQFLELFLIALRSDALKISVTIYLNYLDPEKDIDSKILWLILNSLKNSKKYHEAKLFMLFEHFDSLNIKQLNALIDIYQQAFLLDPEENPILCQYNTIKITLIVYRICWLIEVKQIHSLATKCSILQQHLLAGLGSYLELQSSILLLKKFMTEQILSLREKKDSLDMMNEMGMKELLQHPSIVDVINLVGEGEASITSSNFSLSRTFVCSMEMKTFGQQSIISSLISHIKTFGAKESWRQSSLMYNIWKNCIKQREIDQMFLTMLIDCFLIYFISADDTIHNESAAFQKDKFGMVYYNDYSLLDALSETDAVQFCELELDSINQEHDLFGKMSIILVIQIVGMLTSIIQHIVALRHRDNVQFDFVQVAFRTLMFLISGANFFFINDTNPQQDTGLSTFCHQHVTLTFEDVHRMDQISALRHTVGGMVSYQMVNSLFMLVLTASIINQLRRSDQVGKTMTLVVFMMEELWKFFLTFGLFFIIFYMGQMLLKFELTERNQTYWEIFQEQFMAFNGVSVLSAMATDFGKAFIAGYTVIFRIGLMNFLLAMFINRHSLAVKNLDAYRRFDMISMKNSNGYDKTLGGITNSFFPINLFLLPFLGPLLLFKNPRVSEFTLKLQYIFLIVVYLIFSIVLAVPIAVILYFKMILNVVYSITKNHKTANLRPLLQKLAISVILGHVLILLALMVDLLVIGGLLMKSEQKMAQKYNLYQDKMSKNQTKMVIRDFDRLARKYDKRFEGVHLTGEELMRIHREEFKIIQNLHDLVCRGTKTYKTALSIILDYNMTKVLTKKFSFPTVTGAQRDAKCMFEQIYAIMWDIEVFNHVDWLLRLKETGEMASCIEKGTMEPTLKMYDVDEFNESQKRDEKNGLVPTKMGPDGRLMVRNSSDFLNNIHIDLVYTAFFLGSKASQTTRAEFKQATEKREKAINTEVEGRKNAWIETMTREFKIQSSQLTALAEIALNSSFSKRRQVRKQKLAQRKEELLALNNQDTDNSGNDYSDNSRVISVSYN